MRMDARHKIDADLYIRNFNDLAAAMATSKDSSLRRSVRTRRL